MAEVTRDLKGLAGLFLASGTLHLVRPQFFEPIVPRSLPGRRELVQLSGVAEIVCAAGLLHPRTRRVAGWASAALLLAVLPANVQMTVDAHRRAQRTGERVPLVLTLARLPLQAPMVRTALKATRGAKRA
jgi:uncharacterized membrane protein